MLNLNHTQHVVSAFLLFAIFLLFLSKLETFLRSSFAKHTLQGTIILPFQQLLVEYKTLQVIACADYPLVDAPCDEFLVISNVVGFDPEPHDLSQVPLRSTVPAVSQNVHGTNDIDIQPQLWANLDMDHTWTSNDLDNYLSQYQADGDRSTVPAFFVSALPNGMTTSVPHQHVIRLSSSIACNRIDMSDLPSICPDPMPFISSLDYIPPNDTHGNSSLLKISIRICARALVIFSRQTRYIRRTLHQCINPPHKQYAIFFDPLCY